MNRVDLASLAPAAKRQEILELYRRHVNAGQARLASLMELPVEHSSAGAYVFDHTGRCYLDAGGYGVFLLGHAHPRVVSAVSTQLREHALSTRLLINGEQALAAAALADHCPGDLQYVFFCNSGTEAAEAGIKLAQLNGCEMMVSMSGGYHGKTLGALSVTGREVYTQPFADRLGPTRFVPFGDATALDALLQHETGKACVILEPVQAEAGVMMPPSGYLQLVRDICDRHGALLIFDEIQCGMGRTGYWWASDREAVTPDIMLVGKSLSGGCIPVGAMVANSTVYQPFNRNPLIHSSTFGGNPVAMAAVRATLAAMDEEKLVQRACSLGEHLERVFRKAIAERGYEQRLTLRVAGLLIGIEFADASNAAALVMAMLEQNVIVCHSLNDHRVVRLTPPATLSQEDCDVLAAAFDAALAKVFA